MFIIHNLVKILDKRVNHIKYRNNVVTGVIAVDNGNKTYDVFIAGSTGAYPDIPTTLPNPDFSINDPVEVITEYGDKESLIIIGYSNKVVQEFVEEVVNNLIFTIGTHTVSDTNVYFEGRIEGIDGYVNCIERGFYYGISTGYGSEISSTGSFAAGSYSLQATGLTQNSLYNFQAFVLDSDGDEHVGENMTVTTLPEFHKIYSTWLDGSDYWLLQHGTTGNLLNSWEIDGADNIGNKMAVDADDNVYIVSSSQNKIYKYDNSGNLILTKTELYNIYNIAIGYDGYLYTQQYTVGGTGGNICKRNTSDLVSTGVKSLGSNLTYYGMTIDTDGKIYMVCSNRQDYETWDFVGGKENNSTGAIEYQSASLALMGSNLVNIDEGIAGHGILLPKDYSDGGVGVDIALEGIIIPRNLASNEGSCLAAGTSSGGSLAIGRYDSSLAKVWTVDVDIMYDYVRGIGAYPF